MADEIILKNYLDSISFPDINPSNIEWDLTGTDLTK